jgi:hypothetical protein
VIHLDPESCASKGDRTTTTSSFPHTSNRLRFCGYGRLQRPQFNHTGLPWVPIFSHPPRFRKSTLSCQWRMSNCGTPLAVFTCTFVEWNQHLLFPNHSTIYNSISSPSWEFFTTLEYEWKVIRRRLPYRWTIWVCEYLRFTLIFSTRGEREPATRLLIG